jgi:hypothetical protein
MNSTGALQDITPAKSAILSEPMIMMAHDIVLMGDMML